MFKKLFQQWKMKKLAGQLRKPHGVMGKEVGLMMNKANEFLYDFTTDAMELKGTDQLLEIGFGNGLFFKKIFDKAPGITINGIDFSSVMLKAAENNNRDVISSGKLKLVAGQSDQLPFADNSFDKVFCINVAYFWDNPANHLKEIKRVLKPGGKFFATVRTPESMQFMPFTKYGFRSYTEEQWKQLAEQCGFIHHPALLMNEPPSKFADMPFRFQSFCFTAEKKGD